MRKRVAIATPASLIALLWAVAHGWQQVDVARNAKEIQVVGRELHESVLRFVLKNQRLGKALESAVKAHNESIGAFDEGVLRKGRRFAELVVGGVDESQLQIEAVEGQVRVSKSAVAEVGGWTSARWRNQRSRLDAAVNVEYGADHATVTLVSEITDETVIELAAIASTAACFGVGGRPGAARRAPLAAKRPLDVVTECNLGDECPEAAQVRPAPSTDR